MLHPKKVGTLPVAGSDEEKQTNEIKTAIPLLDAIDIRGKTITADALLTQRDLARYLVKKRGADYHFTVKGNQKLLLEEIVYCFDHMDRPPDFTTTNAEHGRIETRNIWVTTELNGYLNFPYVGQAFRVERITHIKSTHKERREVAHGITSKRPEKATATKVLKDNRGHWSIENSCHYIIDWIYDEDRSFIRTGHGPENITRLRRFAVGLIKGKKVKNVSQKVRQLAANTRLVFDYLKMTRNSAPVS